MRRTLLGIAAGAMALALSAEAGACSRVFQNRAYDPIIADMVSAASSVEIARLISVAPLPRQDGGASQAVETHDYRFQTIEFLHGSAGTDFNLHAGPPLGATIPDECLENGEFRIPIAGEICLNVAASHFGTVQTETLAASGHRDWSGFFWFSSIHDGFEVDIPASYPVSSSCSSAFGLLPGMTYLVFRDESGVPFDGRGLNFRPVSQADDEWRRAVEFFIAHPEEARLPAITPETVLARYNFAAVGVYHRCPAFRPRTFDSHHPTSEIGAVEILIRGEDDSRVPTNYADFRNGGTWADISDCPEGGRYLFLDDRISSDFLFIPDIRPIPIREGMVDLSGIPSQYRIEPIEVPLEDVISWLSEEAETE